MTAGFSIFARYVCRQFLLWFACLLLGLIGLILLGEMTEMVRRIAGRPSIGLLVALEMSLLKMPAATELLFHLAVLFGAMFTFWRLNRSQELIVARASGLSAAQVLLPVVLAAAAVGGVKIAVLNPIGAAMYGKYEQLEGRYFQGGSTIAEISRRGLWLRQRGPDGLSVIHAARAAPDAATLSDVMILEFDADDAYLGRIDADTARLGDGAWTLAGAWVSRGAGQPRLIPSMRLPTGLTRDTILESIASPERLSFWSLPELIDTLEQTGFSAVRHRLHYDAMLSQPVLLAAMVLFAAAFSFRHLRRGGALPLLVAGVLTGFALFVLADFVTALGTAEIIPVPLAAWAPAGAALLIGAALLLHVAEG